jgi:hypothetical protein
MKKKITLMCLLAAAVLCACGTGPEPSAGAGTEEKAAPSAESSNT